jgi:hypothetical protein
MAYIIGIIKKNGTVISQRVEKRPEADEYILSIAEQEPIKIAKIRNTETKEEEIITFEEGK